MKNITIGLVLSGILFAGPAFAKSTTQQVTGGQPTCQLSASPLTFHSTTDTSNPIWNTETVTWSTTKGAYLAWNIDGHPISEIPTTATGTYTFVFWYQTPYPLMSITLEVFGSASNKFTACTVNLTAI